MPKYPFAAILRNRDKLAHLEVGSIEADNEDEAYCKAINFALNVRQSNKLFTHVEIVKIGEPIV